MLQALPTEFWVVAGMLTLLMAVAAFFLGAPQWWQRGLARSALVVSCAGLFICTMTYVSLLVAVIVVILPLLLIITFFTNLFGGLF